MIGKAPGAVVCAHCRKAVGENDCALCKRTVCAACRRNWASCDVPHGVELRLGLGKRLRSVDRNGRYGLVTGWNGRFAFVDLHEARWLLTWNELPTTRNDGAGVPRPYPVVTADGKLLHWGKLDRLRRSSFIDGAHVDVSGGAAGFLHELVLDYRERYAVGSRSDERVVLVDIENARLRTLEPLQRKVVQTVACDGTDRLLCSGSYGVVHVDRFAEYGEKLRCLGTLPIRDADIAWIGVASRRVAVASIKGTRSTLRVFQLDRDLNPDPKPIYRFPKRDRHRYSIYAYGGRRSMVAALSPDGRYVAIVERNARAVDVHDIHTKEIHRIGGHSDRVNLVQFTARTQHLVSANYDNRVFVHPLHEGRFVTQTRKLQVK